MCHVGEKYYDRLYIPTSRAVISSMNKTARLAIWRYRIVSGSLLTVSVYLLKAGRNQLIQAGAG